MTATIHSNLSVTNLVVVTTSFVAVATKCVALRKPAITINPVSLQVSVIVGCNKSSFRARRSIRRNYNLSKYRLIYKLTKSKIYKILIVSSLM